MEHHRIEDEPNAIRLVWPAWITKLIQGSAALVAVAYLMHFLVADLDAQMTSLRELITTHMATTVQAIDRRDTFENRATLQLDILVNLQRQTCVNVAKTEAQADACLKVK